MNIEYTHHSKLGLLCILALRTYCTTFTAFEARDYPQREIHYRALEPRRRPTLEIIDQPAVKIFLPR